MSTTDESIYNKRGVSSDKEDVHNAIKKIDKGLFPNAFCKIIADMVAGDPAYCNIMHADGVGTKLALAYIYWRETGDMSVWKGIVQDGIVMNLDDLICVGAAQVPILLSNTIGRNKNLIPAEVLSEIINGTEEFVTKMRKYGIDITTTGGETADVGDLVRTLDINYTAACRMKRSDVVDINIQDGVIIGLSSTGKASYESQFNSGIGSNGLTSARHDIFHRKYTTKYPESFDPILLTKKLAYCGKYDLKNQVSLEYCPTHQGKLLNVGQLVLSPTRTYAPIIKKVLEQIDRKLINGIIHCSGGGQTKVLHFAKNVHIIKNNMFPIPVLFRIIQKESGTSWQEMYKVFNMGHRMELYVPYNKIAGMIIDIAREFDVDARIIGNVKPCNKTRLTIKTEHGTFEYPEKK